MSHNKNSVIYLLYISLKAKKREKFHKYAFGCHDYHDLTNKVYKLFFYLYKMILIQYLLIKYNRKEILLFFLKEKTTATTSNRTH